MKIKKVATSVQQKLVQVLPEQLHRQVSSRKGWPVGTGRDKSVMWQPTCWPSGGSMPRAAQRLLQR